MNHEMRGSALCCIINRCSSINRKDLYISEIEYEQHNFFYYLKQHDVNNRLPDKLVENGVTFSNKKLCRYKIMKFFILREQMAKSFVWVTAGLALMEI